MGEMLPTLQDAHHRADFAGRAAGDVEKGQELAGSAALEALGNVVGNRKRGALELIAQSGMWPESIECGELVHQAGQLSRFLPNRQVFKASVLHIRYAESQISDFKSHKMSPPREK